MCCRSSINPASRSIPSPTELVRDGVRLFADAADKLYGAVAHKRAAVLVGGIDPQHMKLGSMIGKAVEKATEDWRASATIRRLWQKDKSVWTGTDENKWLGWLNSAAAADIADYEDYAQRVKGQNFTDAVVLGMGGSSLGPEVLALTFARQPGFPQLHVLDSTDPAQVRSLQASVNLANTVFIVSSKSGGTTEPNAMKDYFFARVSEAIGADKAGHRFIAVTDPGSSLEKVAIKQGFARIFHGDPTVGGRYSVLSPFGLVPAATAGIDVRTLINHTLAMVRSCGPDVPPHENPGVQLGLAMGLAGLEGRDKVTILSSPDVADFGAWAEQLIAESTGKNGKGLIPIDGEPLGEPALYGNDRFFIDLRTESENDAAHEDSAGGAGGGRTSRGSHRHEIDRPYRPGILPLRNGDRGGRLGARHQSVQPARRRGCQDQDPAAHRRIREIRLAAVGKARDDFGAGRSLHRREKCR